MSALSKIHKGENSFAGPLFHLQQDATSYTLGNTWTEAGSCHVCSLVQLMILCLLERFLLWLRWDPLLAALLQK